MRQLTAAAALVSLAVCGAFAIAGGGARAEVRTASRHVIAVRVVNRSGQLFDRRNRRRFVPRGANYVRLDASGHSTFKVGRYSTRRTDAALTRMRGLSYNTVRVFIAGECRSGCVGTAGGGISRRYVRNVVDFLRRLRKRNMVAILTTGFLPPA